MAAITIKFGVQADVNELESELANETGRGLSGLGDTNTDAASLAQSHASLLNMVYLRRACAEVLAGRDDGRGPRKITVSFEGRNVWLNLDRPLPQEPAWNPPTQDGLRRFKLTSWTSKMGTPSFSLPAGAPALGGSCPGAAGGQSPVPVNPRKAQLRVVSNILGTEVEPAKAICQHCYAEGGQYSTGQVQYAQLMRFAWAQAAVADGTFVAVMDWAVKNANYYLGGKGKMKTDDVDDDGKPIYIPVRGERDGEKYFRIHDSGDFFSLQYLAAWVEVAHRNPDVTFWAPSRIWALPEWLRAVNQINTAPNLVIRPSAYAINERDLVTRPRDTRFAPNPLKRLGPGWAAGTTVYGDKITPKDLDGSVIEPNIAFDWDCKAYQTDNDKVTCRDAMSPDGQRGCRACWKHGRSGARDEQGSRGIVVNYTLH